MMNIHSKVILEVGVNHLGDVKEAKKFLNFFLKSKFKKLTFMIHSKEFYSKMQKRIDYQLSKNFYSKAIKLAHKKKKKIGLAVCDLETYTPHFDINFDFYKLLGIGINNKELIKKLASKKKNVFISLAQGSDSKINNSLKFFGRFKKLALIYTVRSYNPNHLDLNRISYLRKKYDIPVGYGHHFINALPIFLSSFFKPSFFFLYIKNNSKKRKLIPDNDHAFFTNQLEEIMNGLNDATIMLKEKKLVHTKINIKSIVQKFK